MCVQNTPRNLLNEMDNIVVYSGFWFVQVMGFLPNVNIKKEQYYGVRAVILAWRRGKDLGSLVNMQILLIILQ